MNCYLHSDLPAVAFCRSCGRGLCTTCQRVAEGTVFCQEHVPVTYASAPRPDPGPNPYFQQSSGFAQPGASGPGYNSAAYSQPGFGPSAPPQTGSLHASPGLAFLLGLIPGVGAIYNGQYLKGFIHVAILGVLISMVSSGHFGGGIEPFLGLLIGIWFFYMPFEAYHTARKRQSGVSVDEWSSLLPRGSASGPGRLPVGPVVLIALGVLFLLDNLGLLPLSDVLRYWPLILIGLGVSSLYSRLSGPLPVVPPPPPPSGPVPPPRSGGDPITGDAVGGAR